MHNIESLIPIVAVVTDIKRETPDVKTFRVVGLDGKKPFEHMPGQCAMLSIPGIGEALFSITSSPTSKEYVEFSIKKVRLRNRSSSRNRTRSTNHVTRTLRQTFPRRNGIQGQRFTVYCRRYRFSALT